MTEDAARAPVSARPTGRAIASRRSGAARRAPCSTAWTTRCAWPPQGIAAAQRDRNGWAIRIFEIWRGRQLYQLGRLDDAGAILDGQFSPETR